MAERTLTVKIVGDDRDLRRAFASSEKSAQSFSGKISGTTAGLTKNFLAAGVAAGATAVSFQAVTSAIGASVTAASDLDEQLSRTQVILGENADATIDWSTTTAESFGISQRAALAATATFAGLFQTVGVSVDEAGQLSRSLVELAADLASLQNSSPEEALIALRSGLAGEAEPLRRFNIFLTEARVAQEALRESGKRSVTQLTAQEKTLARYNLILRDSAPAHGNFALTQDGLANQSRILRAQLDDLSTNIGGALIPILTDAADAANALFDALDKMRGVDFSPGFDFPDPPSWLRGLALAPISPALAGVAVGRAVAREFEPDPIEQAIPGDISRRRDLAKQAEDAAKEQRTAALEADRAIRRATAAYSAFVRGLGLKLDKAQLTASLADDLSVLRELERAILRRIEVEGKTFKLVQALTNVRLQINSTAASQAQAAADASSKAFTDAIDALSLDLEAAQATQSLADDIPALRAIEQAILSRIAAEGKTTDLMRQLFQNREEQAQVIRELAERDRARRQARQFKALGLTSEGEERVPGREALERRRQNLLEQITGTKLDTPEVRAKIAEAGRVLAGEYGKVGREVRRAILAMFNTWSDALDQGQKGPLTKTSGLNTKKILAGMGLSPDEIRELRGRLSSINTAGLQLAGAGTVGAAAGAGRPGRESGFFVESHTTINLDGVKVASVVTRNQQKAKRRNPKQKRGPNRVGGV